MAVFNTAASSSDVGVDKRAAGATVRVSPTLLYPNIRFLHPKHKKVHFRLSA